jgi:hypothetical protein
MNGYALYDGMRRATVRDILKRACSCAPLVLAGVPLTTMAQDTPAAEPAAELAAAADTTAFQNRADIVHLPMPLKNFLTRIAGRAHATYEPLRVFAEADKPSQLFQWYLLDTSNFQPNVFTAVFPGVNDHAIPTAANAANHQLSTIGAVRLALEPKPGLPTDPTDVEAFIDIFTDISGLFVINNESGWYEGWMIHDLVVPAVAPPHPDGRPQFGTMTSADAAAIAALGAHHNVPGKIFTTDGNDVRFPSATDVWPNKQANVVPLALSMGAYNCLQQSDCHAYWEFNEYTNWIFPLYELPSTGGIKGDFAAGKQYSVSSVIPGSGPSGVSNNQSPLKQKFGDDPNNPRDPDRGPNASPTDPDRPTANDDDQKETRLRFVPSGLANEIMLDAVIRLRSFEPNVTSPTKRLNDAYAKEVARVDQNGDGVLTFVEADAEGQSDGQSNERLLLPPTVFNRFAVTREINDGLLAPRFAPSQRAYVLSGTIGRVKPSVPASISRDGDDR